MSALFNVANGKFHRPAQATTRDKAWRPTQTVCGLTVTPSNYFETPEDANRYTGGNLHTHMCKHCGLES